MNRNRQLTIKHEDKEKLVRIAKSMTVEVRKSKRAKMLLLKASGKKFDEIAQLLEVNRKTVMRCVNKYEEGGLECAMTDKVGRGSKPFYSDEEKACVINLACTRPVELGLCQETWSYGILAEYVRKHASVLGYPRLQGIVKSTVRSILEAEEIKPHKIKYYCERRDPEFNEKMHTVLVVYKQMELQFNDDTDDLPYDPDTTHTISYDEKPGIQAIANTAPDKRPRPGNGVISRDYEYKRLGTMSLLCGIDLETGKAYPLVRPSHKSSDFVDFLSQLDAHYPQGHTIRLILDNHIIHKSKETKRYLETCPGRFLFVFTPKHGSWLNMIEGFFSKMTRQLLKHIRVDSKEEMELRIYQYIDELNQNPKPFRWKYKMDEIGKEEVADTAIPLLPIKTN